MIAEVAFTQTYISRVLLLVVTPGALTVLSTNKGAGPRHGPPLNMRDVNKNEKQRRPQDLGQGSRVAEDGRLVCHSGS